MTFFWSPCTCMHPSPHIHAPYSFLHIHKHAQAHTHIKRNGTGVESLLKAPSYCRNMDKVPICQPLLRSAHSTLSVLFPTCCLPVLPSHKLSIHVRPDIGTFPSSMFLLPALIHSIAVISTLPMLLYHCPVPPSI